MTMISLRLSDEELVAVDRVRGGQERSAWLRDLARCAVLCRDGFGGPCSIRMRAVPVGEAPDVLNGASVWVGGVDAAP